MNRKGRIAFDLSDEEFELLATAARLHDIPANTIARALFRWAFPVFESQQFSVANLKQRFGEGSDLIERLDPNANRRQKPAKPKAG